MEITEPAIYVSRRTYLYMRCQFIDLARSQDPGFTWPEWDAMRQDISKCVDPVSSAPICEINLDWYGVPIFGITVFDAQAFVTRSMLQIKGVMDRHSSSNPLTFFHAEVDFDDEGVLMISCMITPVGIFCSPSIGSNFGCRETYSLLKRTDFGRLFFDGME